MLLRMTVRVASLICCIWMAAAVPASGQTPASSRPCPPPGDRHDEPKPTCVTGTQSVGRLPPGEVFWHLDTYPMRADAESARGPAGLVVESLGRIWLFTIAETGWRPRGGERIATIGPLPVAPDREYTAVYMESIFAPGTTAAMHTHSGPEAFFTLTGDTCLETPEGVLRGTGPGNVVIVKGGPPMLLTATGTTLRRGVVLILHDSSQPATTLVSDWTPKGLCKG